MYRFLEFFSNFDWEKFCLSLWGPVPISSLPDMTAEPPRMDSGKLLLNKSFLDTCSTAYGVVPRTQENQGRPFVSKHFNIVDPLRANNNLGRSVSKGNFFRIRSAFAFGAKRLGKLLECPKEDLVTELNQFFTNTWTRHGSGSRTDVQPLKVFPSVASNSHTSKRNILTSEVSSNHSTKSSRDKSVSSLNSSSHPSAKEVSDSNSVSSSYREDNGCVLNEELPSVSESSGIRHDEQDLVTLMDSVKLHEADGQIRSPMQKPSHLSVAHSPLLAPIAFSQKHLAGVPPPNLVGAPWLPNMQFLHGFVTPTSQYMHNPTWAPNVEEGSESEEPITSDADHDTNKSWHQYGIGCSGQFDLEARDPHIYDMDGKERPSLPNGVHGAPLERQMEFAVENNGADDETYTSMFQDQTSREGNVDYAKRSGFVNVLSPDSSSRGKTLDACSWDEVTVNTRSSRDKSGKRLGFAAPATSTHSKTGGQMGNATDHRPTEVDDGPRKGIVVPIIKEASEIVAGPDYFSTQSRTSASYLIDSPQQRQADNSGLTFVPTGAPVPFVVFPFVPGNSDGSGPHFDRSEGIDQLPANIASQNLSSLSDVDQPDSGAISTPSINTMTEPSGEHKPDILNGDLVSHWHNLQYARFCQTARPLGPVLYPFPVPPMYLHGHAPWDGPGRPAAPNVNWAQMIGPGQRVFPVMPLQPAAERGTGVFQHYGEDAPRYRGGTGTYFPNPKVPFRDRHSYSRNYRGGYNGDRSDYSDKEGSWINSKQRNPNRSYGRSQSERSGMRSDRHVHDESHKSDRQRRTYINDSYRHEASSQYVIQGQSFGSAGSMRKPGNIAHEVYTPQSTASNAAGALSGPPGPPFVMVYSYEPGANHGASTSEPIEFGSLGPLPTEDGDDIPRSTRQVMPNGFYGQRRGPYRGGSSHSSPDQPSSPQPRR